MLLLGEQDFAATGHDSFDANAIVMVTLRQATSSAGESEYTLSAGCVSRLCIQIARP
jgi:hypothetical protein